MSRKEGSIATLKVRINLPEAKALYSELASIVDPRVEGLSVTKRRGYSSMP